VQQDNYHRFFNLYRATPSPGSVILDMILDGRRLQALQRICRAYKPSVPLGFVISELAFDSEEEGQEFLKKAGCVTNDFLSEGTSSEGLEINTKDTVIDFSAVFTQDKLLM
jgi:hypothetical protein